MPTLERYISAATIWLLPDWSTGPQNAPNDDTWPMLADAGYRGVQVLATEHVGPARRAGLDVHGVGRADTVDQLDEFIQCWSTADVSSVTVHLGTGFEARDEGNRLIAHLDAVSGSVPFELLLETHRATITQDPARTLEIIEQHPSLRFTADLAHWYVGVEMTYGGFDWKVERLAPVFRRTRLVHGRIASTGCSQMPLHAVGCSSDEPTHIQHFRHLWGELFRELLDSSDPPARLPFAPELLPPRSNYARTVIGDDGEVREEVDRWEQARLLCELAESLFDDAVEQHDVAGVAHETKSSTSHPCHSAAPETGSKR